MKKMLLFLFAVTLSVNLFASSNNYNFSKLQEKMEKDGFKLEYVKKDSGFNFKKGDSHVEVVDYKSYDKLNDAMANSINLLTKKGFMLVPEECDFGSGVLIFTNPTVENYAFVLSANYKKNILLNTGGTPKDIEFSVKTLEETLKPSSI